MIPGMNPKLMKQAMKKMGLKQEEIEASEVIIRCQDKDLVFRNPQVTKVEMMGQETWQIVGQPEEVEAGSPAIPEDDMMLIMEQTGCSRDKAKKALENANGDLAKAILVLQK